LSPPNLKLVSPSQKSVVPTLIFPWVPEEMSSISPLDNVLEVNPHPAISALSAPILSTSPPELEEPT